MSFNWSAKIPNLKSMKTSMDNLSKKRGKKSATWGGGVQDALTGVTEYSGAYGGAPDPTQRQPDDTPQTQRQLPISECSRSAAGYSGGYSNERETVVPTHNYSYSSNLNLNNHDYNALNQDPDTHHHHHHSDGSTVQESRYRPRFDGAHTYLLETPVELSSDDSQVPSDHWDALNIQKARAPVQELPADGNAHRQRASRAPNSTHPYALRAAQHVMPTNPPPSATQTVRPEVPPRRAYPGMTWQQTPRAPFDGGAAPGRVLSPQGNTVMEVTAAGDSQSSETPPCGMAEGPDSSGILSAAPPPTSSTREDAIVPASGDATGATNHAQSSSGPAQRAGTPQGSQVAVPSIVGTVVAPTHQLQLDHHDAADKRTETLCENQRASPRQAPLATSAEPSPGQAATSGQGPPLQEACSGNDNTEPATCHGVTPATNSTPSISQAASSQVSADVTQLASAMQFLRFGNASVCSSDDDEFGQSGPEQSEETPKAANGEMSWHASVSDSDSEDESDREQGPEMKIEAASLIAGADASNLIKPYRLLENAPQAKDENRNPNTSDGQPKSPAPNESCPRRPGGEGGLAGGLTKNQKLSEPPLQSPPASPSESLLPAAVILGTESSARESFLDSQNKVAPVSPGNDVQLQVGKLVDRVIELQKDSQLQLKRSEKRHQSLCKRIETLAQQNVALTDQLRQEISDKAKQVAQLGTQLESAKITAKLYDEVKAQYQAARDRAEAADGRNSMLERDAEARAAQVSGLLAEVDTLKRRLGEAEASHVQELAAAARRRDDELAKLKSEFKDGMEEAAQNHKWEMERERAAMLSEHNKALEAKDFFAVDLRHQHDAEMRRKNDEILSLGSAHKAELDARDQRAARLAAKHEADVGALRGRHRQELQAKDDEIAAAKASVVHEIARVIKKSRATIEQQQQQIASYTKDGYAFAEMDDTALGRSFQALVGEVNQLAGQVRPPGTLDFDSSFDPTDCLGRNASPDNWIWPRFLRSTCWSILLAGFFSMPLGFGALGSAGEGHAYMHPTYQAATIMGSNAGSNGATTSTMTSTFPNDKEANVYRALHFKRILSAVRADQGAGSVALAVMFNSNVARTAEQLCEVLGHIADTRLKMLCVDLASSICRKTGMLALEMGAQRAHVVLEVCRHREVPSSPASWKTEETAAAAPGSQVVDLMVHPCLVRIGDGRDELQRKKVVAKGEFVPLST